MNNVKLKGKIVFDVSLKHTYSGKDVCNFVLDVKRSEGDSFSDYVDCVAWNEIAVDLCKIAVKGLEVEVDGYVVNDNYTDHKGISRKIQKVLAVTIRQVEGS